MDFRKGEIIAIDKPYRMSSFGALAHVRYLLSKKLGFKVKIGHAGTLDPLATGVLVLCTGKCTKQIEQLQTHTKEYTATLQLGATTASYDKEHSVNHTYPTKHITRELVEEVLKQFVGEIQQVPPTYSAVKVNGDRSYALRRAGEEVQLKPKTVRVDEIELTGYDDDLFGIGIHFAGVIQTALLHDIEGLQLVDVAQKHVAGEAGGLDHDGDGGFLHGDRLP